MLVGTVLTIVAGGKPAIFREAMREVGIHPSPRMEGFRFRRNGGKLEVFRVIERPSERNNWACAMRLVVVLNPQSSLAHRLVRAGRMEV